MRGWVGLWVGSCDAQMRPLNGGEGHCGGLTRFVFVFGFSFGFGLGLDGHGDGALALGAPSPL